MSDALVKRTLVINSPQGLHARPAEVFARRAMQFTAQIDLVLDNQRVDAKSILHILTLGADQGTELIIEARGLDAQQAVEALAQLVIDGFADDENTKKE